MITKGLSPEKVFNYFEEISRIPRGSKEEKAISDWLVKFAEDRHLEVYQDEFLNVIIKKPATKGYEKYSTLIIQGHMDMVWEKNSDTTFDFDTQGIELVVKDGYLSANGTTLGADNGIAVAYALAILDSDDIKHPSLEVLLTADEEKGMTGVKNFDPKMLSGKTLLNIDTEEYGDIYVSSAGGSRIQAEVFLKTEKIGKDVFRMEVKGLNGGHSGADIHLGLGNSIKIVFEMLSQLSKKYNVNIVNIAGGDKVNAIPREASTCITLSLNKKQNIADVHDMMNQIIKLQKEKYKNVDKDLTITFEPLMTGEYSYQLVPKDSSRIINYFNSFPSGMQTMSAQIDGLVETSLNLGVIRFENTSDKVRVSAEALFRSSVLEALRALESEAGDLAGQYGFNYRINERYNPWEYNEKSKLRNLFSEAYKEIEKKDIGTKAIHAGLECGILCEKIPNLDVISIGPNIYGAHTPEERLEIASVDKTWKLILKALEMYNI